MPSNGFRVLVEGLDHPEGVAVGPDGTLYAGGEAGQVYRIEETGPVEVANTGGFLLGMAADGDGRLYACDVARREVLRVDPLSGSTEVYASGTPERPMVNPNWPVFDDDGNLYVTDSGTWKGDDGCIFRVSPAGEAEVWSTASTAFPNGACLTANGGHLLVLESVPGALVRIPVADPSAREVIVELPDAVPDGICLDTDGTAYVFCYRPDRVYRIADGTLEVFADDPQGTLLAAPTNGVFVGTDRTTLVCGNLGRWHLSACEVDTPGLPLRYPSPSGSPK
ncbi:MAG TPA: SMP-30/gluconolactonase/LRE family protein [Actinomycetota bacterium]|nr:SMP-30/gluconolactonase/LRE family protein [Actinomycetota bacterium]